ncbi:MAG: hypothetical protein GY738_29760 [Pseudoalteromonas sp.]|nr:hypothetical protein [Pseudoalteromonas sp.]
MEIINLYLPPHSSCPPQYLPNFNLLFDRPNDTILVGDFNAHNPAWNSISLDQSSMNRGEALLEALNESSLCLLNEDSPTRLPSFGQPTSPDLSLCSAHLALDFSWHTLTTLRSDHLPILLSLPEVTRPPRPVKTFHNFRKADWDTFTLETETLFENAPDPSSCSQGEAIFRKILQTASKHSIPSGFIKNKNTNPSLPQSAKPLIQQRDSLRISNPHDPQIQILNDQISSIVIQHSNKKWQDILSKSDHRTNPSKFWSLLKSLSGKNNSPPSNQPISFNNKVHTSHLHIAQSFTKQFTSVSRHTSNPISRKIIRKLRRHNLLNRNFQPFTPALVLEAIKQSSNSSALGPDHLNILHLKNLGPNGISFLTKLFNLSISSANIPAIWKLSKIITLLKPGKPPDLSTSYRPISLLCPAAKVLERLLLPYLKQSLSTHPTQHGFKPLHSTTSSLLNLSTTIANGFNQNIPPSRTTVASIDLSKAFDCIPIHLLLQKISSSNLHPNIIRWLSCYLRGRMAYCSYKNTNSSPKIVHTGVPQGSVISPVLFNFYIADAPHLPPANTSSYADDLNSYHSSPKIPQSVNFINSHLSSIADWASSNGLSIAPNKSTVTLFTPDRRFQSNLHPQVKINGSTLPLEKTPKILGVTFDTFFTFSSHISTITSKLSSRLKILKCLAGTKWGHQKETLLTTYNTLLRPITTYACPVWFPNTSNNHINKLQVLQNQALRICTGSTKKSPISHLHQETKILPVQNHLSLLCSQYLASSLRPSHPSFSNVTTPPGPRSKKSTLQSKFLHTVQPFLSPDNTLHPNNYKFTISQLHTSAVTQAINSYPPNPVLNHAPPDINPSEIPLPRHYRTILSQLRSNYCPKLQSYLHSINASLTPNCPSCPADPTPETVHHLFSCPNNPTNLNPIDLWHNPHLVAAFLSTHPSFTGLPPLPRPPPEPPP